MTKPTNRFKSPLSFLILILLIASMGFDHGIQIASHSVTDSKHGVPYLLLSINRSADEQSQTTQPVYDADEEVEPTATPRPTKAPPVIPPEQDLTQTNLMILFVILSVVVIIVGVWINRYGEDE
jgi:hypothetical protein